MNDMKQRSRNAMFGLAIGDAISWTSMFHRSVLLPPWTRRIRREIDAASETTNVIVTPMPFSLNQSATHFNISPTDETEWAAFSAQCLLDADMKSYHSSVMNNWKNLAQSEEPVRGGISNQAALNNLRNGILPPQSGKQNPHYFDDGAMARAVPIGIICAGNSESAAHLAEIDASITNSEDGVWAAQAMAAAMSIVCSGGNIDDAIDTAYNYLPENSWIKRTVGEAAKLSTKCDSVFSIIPELQNQIVNREYSFGNVAPETLALTFLIAKLHGNNFENAVTTASSFAKCGETLPAMVGALVGAQHSTSIASESWMNAIGKLKGICIPSLKDENYIGIVEQLSKYTKYKVSL